MNKKLYAIIECQTDEYQHIYHRVLRNFWELDRARRFYENYLLSYRDLPDTELQKILRLKWKSTMR